MPLGPLRSGAASGGRQAMGAPAARPDVTVAGDEELVAAARAGDGRAFETIVLRYAPTVERLIRRFFGPGPDHPDLCQEVFIRLFSRLGELRSGSTLRGFVFSIALGVSRNELRRARLRRFVGLDDDDRERPELATGALDEEAREAARHLYAVLETLGADDRSLFVARFIEKLELAELATIHGFSYGTAKRRVARLAERMGHRLRRDPVLARYAEEFVRG